MNKHTSLEKYTSHTLFSKGLCVIGELEREQTATLLSHSAGLINQGSLRAASLLSGAGSHCLKLQLKLQLTDSNCN